MARLIHLNGPPGIGKSTLAQRYVDDHPGVLNCDVDRLRRLVGGWRDDFYRTGALIRPAALAMIRGYLENGHDVVLPQMLVDSSEIERFEQAAHDSGAEFIECLFTDHIDAVVARYRSRQQDGAQDPWLQHVGEVIDRAGGEEALRCLAHNLEGIGQLRERVVVVQTVDGDIDATYRGLLHAVRDWRLGTQADADETTMLDPH